ncbi:type I restriction enzyme EcoKI subunit R [Chryseobacterium taklimakanense]|uniref:Type I restriction enzyme EcoKI subunit R n=1 Tax=Chryseobacterium taklimakanense TaxID=536441 RepID=A0A239WBS2_9FLAO|nr:DEAD/DEAH box helicase family protein [Chryseobacterium taklimakanense]SNV31961.1 type I restriction enzyme EcoKI subunit R [Chryseobacterium taklimakanense]
MDNTANYIKQRLSLRKPLQDSLDVVAQLADKLTLKKQPENPEEATAFLKEELAKVQEHYPFVKNFQRDFPSLAFSIATGVGKTRLMGACIAYLAINKGIKNFFVLAPNLTIYEKLIKDFGDPGYAKYVFNGISEFVHNRPVIITGDNYNQQGNLFDENEIRINIFNISKFNSDNKGTKKGGVALAPKIKRLSEYLGQSYWDYLTGINDLVILMDEAHRYHADASKNAINELKPVLGLELTATPTDEKGNVFQNIVYEYNLAQALADGEFVKNPAIAKRKNFVKGSLSDADVDRIKLEDAVSVHRQTKNELDLYSRNNEVKQVKPFILVVCKNIEHAEETYDYINSSEFYEGEYIGKVIAIHSVTRKDEEIESLFVSLENPENQVEIVIHVNMLKEGWDVSNLYTIVPLRAANAKILIEQTIGRGLRLPYDGKRTGVESVDKLTVIAHDNFDAVIEEANDPKSILNKFTFIELDEGQLQPKTEVITSVSTVDKTVQEEQKKVEAITNPVEKQKAQTVVDAKKAILTVLPSFNKSSLVKKVDDLTKEEVKKEVIQKIEENLNKGQLNMFSEQIVAEARAQYESIINSYKENIIEIPRMVLARGEVEAYFSDFDLVTDDFNYRALDQQIIRMNLQDRKVEEIGVEDSGIKSNPVKLIISELLNYPEIDYDSNADLLYKLAQQAVDALENNLDDKSKLSLTVRQFKPAIAEKIYHQMRANFTVTTPEFVEPDVLPFTKIEPHNYTALTESGYRDYRDTISPVSLVPRYVYRGFEKACHFEYKFDSGTEKDFAFILESDSKVVKWLRPAPSQFRIYWSNTGKRYEPDFIVETDDAIYMVEPKESGKMTDPDVLAKKEAALEFCKYASKYNAENGGKPWKYALIPHNAITTTTGFEYLMAQYAD